MEQISKTIIYEYKYKSEEERELHVKYMKSQGFECTGQSMRSDDSLMKKDRDWYWYGKFIKSM